MASKTIGNLVANFKLDSASFESDLNKARSNLSSTSAQMNRALMGAEKGFNNFNRSIKQTVDSTLTFRGAIQALAAVASFRSLTSSLDEFSNIKSRLDVVSDSAHESAFAFQELNKMAIATQSTFSSTAQLYSRFRAATKELGLSQKEVLDLTQAINQSFRISGATTEEASSSALQFAQALGSGRLQGDELRSVLENNATLARILANAFGVPVGALKKLGEEGKLTSDIISKATIASLAQLNTEAARISPTFDRVFTVIKDQVKGGLFRQLSEDASEFNKSLLNEQSLTNLKNFGQLLGIIIKTAIDGFIFLAEKIGGVVQGFVDLDGAGKEWANNFIGLINGTIAVVIELPGQMADAFLEGFDNVLMAGFQMAENLVNGIVERLNKLPGVDLERVIFGENFESSKKGAQDRLGKSFDEIFSTAMSVDYIGSLQDKLKIPEVSNPNAKGNKRTFGDDLSEEANQLSKVIDQLRFRNEQMRRSSEEQELYNQLRSAGVAADSAAGEQIRKLVEEYNGLSAAQKQAEEQTKRNEQFVRDLGLTFTSAFEDAIVQGGKLSDVLKGLAQDIQRLILRKTITEPILGAIGGIFDSGGSSSNGLFSGISKLFGGGKAAGGPMRPDQFYRVGEAGPEIIYSGQGGTVVPNDEMGGGTYYIDARGADDAKIAKLERIIVQLNGSVERRALSVVRNENKRNPRYLS